MKRSPLSARITTEQAQRIRSEFSRCRRVPAESERLIEAVPQILRMAARFNERLVEVYRVMSRRGRATMARDVRKLERAVNASLTVFRRRSPNVWETLTRLGHGDVDAAVDALERIGAGLDGWELVFRRRKWPSRRGERQRFGERYLLELLAETFLELGLPVSTTPSGLFASIAYVLHPAAPETIKHRVLADAIRKARERKHRKANEPTQPAFGSYGNMVDAFQRGQRGRVLATVKSS